MSGSELPDLSEAVRRLRAGELVAIPTETVYGLAADADNEEAVRQIFEWKGRPADHPLIVHLPDAHQMDAWAHNIPSSARQLADAFWPGPLTIILRRSPRARDVVTGGLETVGLRVPAHPITLELLRRLGGAVAAPSANRFGRVSPTRAEHVRAEFADRPLLVLDGGPCPVGLESTIVDLSGVQPRLLRPGAITAEQLAAVLGEPVLAASASSPRVPGRMASHYAPRARVELVTAAQRESRLRELLAAGDKVAVLELAGDESGHWPADLANVPLVSRISLGADLNECARRLYDGLRAVDADGCGIVLITLPSRGGIGAAIADRLLKAAGLGDEA
ncbi:MAG: L-threonylcarbamoyladenylate synthase [Planctomycetota bacterium]